MGRFSSLIAANSSQKQLFVTSAGVWYARSKHRGKSTMPDALQLLRSRRSTKPVELVGPAPSAVEIDTLLTIASRVPDHGKLVPWRFIIFEGDGRFRAGEAIADAFRRNYPQATAKQVEAEHRRLARAPLVIAVVSRAGAHVKIPEWEQVLSAGAAAMSLVLAAHALGYGANWITEWYAYDRRVLDALGLAPNERIAGFVHIGRQSEVPADRPRPPISEIAIRFGMDN
jgi:nitroreductase